AARTWSTTRLLHEVGSLPDRKEPGNGDTQRHGAKPLHVTSPACGQGRPAHARLQVPVARTGRQEPLAVWPCGPKLACFTSARTCRRGIMRAGEGRGIESVVMSARQRAAALLESVASGRLSPEQA